MSDTKESDLPLARLIVRLLLGAVLCGVVAEGGARIDDHRRFGVPWMASPDWTSDLVFEDSLPVRGRPFGSYQGWKLNSAGFRSPESTLTPRAGCVRVMTLGSSESFGYRETPGKEYPAQLAEILKAQGCFQVMNAAMAGFSLTGMRQLFIRWAFRYQPDIVVVLPNPLAYLGDAPPKEPVPNPTPRRVQWWRPRLQGKLRDLVQFPAFIQRRRTERMVESLSLGRAPEWFFHDLPPARLAQFRKDVDAIVADIRERGAEAVLVVHPMKFRSLREPGAVSELQAMRQFGARPTPDILFRFDSAGATVIREVAALRGVETADMPALMNGRHELFADPVHYSNEGAAVIAAAVADAIRRTRAHGATPPIR